MRDRGRDARALTDASRDGAGPGPVARSYVAYVVAMPRLGFVISSAVFLFAAFWFLWRRGPLISLLLAASSLGGVYLVFRKVFQVVLPQGSLTVGMF